MRGPRVQMHVSGLLLLLLLLLSGLTHTVLCQDEEEALDDEATAEGTEAPVSETTPVPEVTDTESALEEGEDNVEGSVGHDGISTVEPTTEVSITEIESLDPLLIIIPVVLVSLIMIVAVCCILIRRKLNSNTEHLGVSKEDPFLDGSSTEKVPMPMFEEDVPSVLELEMEDLDGWIKKDGPLKTVSEITPSRIDKAQVICQQ